MDLPLGILTFLMTDIEGSSRLWREYPEAMRQALADHDRLLRDAVEANGGYVVKSTGDGFLAAFPSAPKALIAAVAAQLALNKWNQSPVTNHQPLPFPDTRYPTPDTRFLLQVRMGLHTGEAQRRDGDYYGHCVNCAARIMAAGHGGQILVSDVTAALARSELPPEITLLDCGRRRLRDVGEERLWQALHPDLPRDFPPLKTLDPERHNLPLPPTPFIGREADMAAWYELLHQPTTRLLTLVGFGGIGKSRAALQLAERCAEDFEDGVWWVELQEALRLLAEDAHNERALALHNLARLYSRRGEAAEARRLYAEALVHRRAAGDLRGEAETLGNLGALAYNAGDYAEARQLYLDSLALYRAQRYPYGIAVALNNLGEVAEVNDDAAAAVALFVHAERILRNLQSADARYPAEALQRLASRLGEERWIELRAAAERSAWEELV